MKPNCLLGADPARAATTHPSLVAALVAALRRRGAAVSVGDNPGRARLRHLPALLRRRRPARRGRGRLRRTGGGDGAGRAALGGRRPRRGRLAGGARGRLPDHRPQAQDALPDAPHRRGEELLRHPRRGREGAAPRRGALAGALRRGARRRLRHPPPRPGAHGRRGRDGGRRPDPRAAAPSRAVPRVRGPGRPGRHRGAHRRGRPRARRPPARRRGARARGDRGGGDRGRRRPRPGRRLRPAVDLPRRAPDLGGQRRRLPHPAPFPFAGECAKMPPLRRVRARRVPRGRCSCATGSTASTPRAASTATAAPSCARRARSRCWGRSGR